jgi:predicted ATPase
MEQTLTHAKELHHPDSIGIVLLFSAQLAQLRREPEPARIHAEEALKVSVENGAPALALWCLLPHGWALAQQGDVAAGIADIRESMDRRRAFGMDAVWPWYLALVAEAYGLRGDFDAGLSALDEAQDWVQRNDERLYAADVHRIRGELLLRQAVPDPAQGGELF